MTANQNNAYMENEKNKNESKKSKLVKSVTGLVPSSY